MASIQNYLNQIKSAVFGKDVRQAIHDAIEECYNTASIDHDNANMEVKLARGTHNTLNDRLEANEEKQENFSEQLEHMITLRLISNIESTNYSINDIIMVDYITRLQNLYMAEFYRNLRKGNQVTIACIGDSMTYGHDTTSNDKRPADSTPCDDGSRHSFTRASITYPESLQKYLSQVYENNITVINRGYSGDYVKKGYERWNKKHNANLSIIMYGTNDSRADYVPEQYRGNISEYIKWLEQAIVREILWGKAVILFIPPKLQSFGDIDIDTFAFALYQLGAKYNIPVIDSELFTINYNGINSDGVHFNGIGYEIFGAKVSSLFVADNLFNPTKIKSGVKLLNRRTIDSFVLKGQYSYTASSGAYTPSELNNTGGSLLNLNTGSKVTYSFYCDEDDLYIVPYIYTTSNKVKIMLDYGLKSCENSLDASIGKGATVLDNNKTVIEYINSGQLLINKDEAFLNNAECLRIPTKGWHTLTIVNEHSELTGGTLALNGIEFINYDVFSTYVNNNRYFKYVTNLKYVTHSVLSSQESISEFRIKPIDYLKLHPFLYANGSEYWRNPPLKLVITDYLKGSIVYTFTIGNNASTTMFHGEYKKIGTYSGGRTVSNITLDESTREIVITFNGGLTNKSNLLLQLV